MRTLSHKATPRPTQLSPEQARADFDELAPFFENQPPELRFLSTGFANLDQALGGSGFPSSLISHWRAPRDSASDALLLQLCRAACERGERVCLVDASNRFGAAALQAAGLDDFTFQGLFERLQLTTFSQLAQLVDAWRRDETEKAPGLLVVNSLVTTVGAGLVKKHAGKSKIPFSKSSRSQATNAPVFDPQGETQAKMFRRLLVKLDGFARACGAGMVVAELPVENMRTLPRYQSKRRRNDFLEYAALHMLADAARVELVLETNPFAAGVVRVCVAPNRFSWAGGAALIALRI